MTTTETNRLKNVVADVMSETEANSPELLATAPDDIATTRPSGINVGGHTVTQATEHLPDKQRDLVRWLHNHARTRRIEWKELANAVDVSVSTLSRIWTDRYKHPETGARVPLDSICEKIAKFKRRMEQAGKSENPDFVVTNVFTKIEWLFQRVSKHHRMGFIYGDGQVGKSTSLKEVTRRNNGGRTTYAEMPPASGVQYMLKCIAKALDVPPHKGFDRLLDDVLAALDPSKTLIIDEIHRAFTTYQRTSVMRCLDTLRYLHDQSGCGLILCGTNVFRDQIKEGEFKAYLKQFHRRGRSYELQLPTTAPWEDVLSIAAWFKLDEPTKEAKEIVEHINSHDGIGVFRMRLVDAQDLADNKRERLNWGHFVRAYAITEKNSR